MLSQDLGHAASQCTGVRTELASAAVQVIANKVTAGWPVAEIVPFLRFHIGPDSPLAARPFVQWAINVAEVRLSTVESAI